MNDKKIIGWWNGRQHWNHDEESHPSISWGADGENSYHDIPLVAITNPNRDKPAWGYEQTFCSYPDCVCSLSVACYAEEGPSDWARAVKKERET